MRKNSVRGVTTICPVSDLLLHDFRCSLLEWYARNGRSFPWRNKRATKYQLIIAEILLQRTRAEKVATFFEKFIEVFPSWRQIAEADEDNVAVFLKPIGLWRRRAKSLKLLSKEMTQRNGEFPKSREELESLPGIGQYIANAVLLFCHDVPMPLLDANMARVLERIFGPRQLVDIRYDPYLQSLSSLVVDCSNPREINWAVLDLASTTCRNKLPLCSRCPVGSICIYKKP